jgi:transcriptional antiterminator RfaH
MLSFHLLRCGSRNARGVSIVRISGGNLRFTNSWWQPLQLDFSPGAKTPYTSGPACANVPRNFLGSALRQMPMMENLSCKKIRKLEMEPDPTPIAELCTSQTEPAWFCVRTRLKCEHIAAAHLRQVPGVDAFNPQLRLLRSTRQGPRLSTESLFPNYIFARFVLGSMLEKVRYTPAVKIVLRFGDQVPEVPDAVIEHLRRDLAELNSEVLTDAPEEGEQVEIVSGAFAGMKGLVTRVLPGKQRARILVDLMGRSVPAELSLTLVVFDKTNAVKSAFQRAESISVGGPIPQAQGIDIFTSA